MSESIASWITLSALFASVGWYVYQSADKNINNLMMCLASGLLCLFGGFLFSGAIMKLVGTFENALVPAILVLIGTAFCISAHAVYKKKKTPQQETQ